MRIPFGVAAFVAAYGDEHHPVLLWLPRVDHLGQAIFGSRGCLREGAELGRVLVLLGDKESNVAHFALNAHLHVDVAGRLGEVKLVKFVAASFNHVVRRLPVRQIDAFLLELDVARTHAVTREVIHAVDAYIKRFGHVNELVLVAPNANLGQDHEYVERHPVLPCYDRVVHCTDVVVDRVPRVVS